MNCIDIVWHAVLASIESRPEAGLVATKIIGRVPLRSLSEFEHNFLIDGLSEWAVYWAAHHGVAMLNNIPIKITDENIWLIEIDIEWQQLVPYGVVGRRIVEPAEGHTGTIRAERDASVKAQLLDIIPNGSDYERPITPRLIGGQLRRCIEPGT